jgi:hypothetical protein
MRRLSSIFSFDTLTALPRPTRSFALTLTICAALRITLGMMSDRLDLVPAPATKTRLVSLEQRLIRHAHATPKILLIGSSLTRYGLLEDPIAAAAGLEPGETVNLGVENGSPWDALVLLRRNPRLCDSVRLVIYGVEPGQINAEGRARWMDHFYRFSTVSEKWAVDHWQDRALLLLDWAWPWHSERRDLITWVQAASGRFPEMTDADLRPAWEPCAFAKLRSKRARFERSPSPDEIIGMNVATSPLYEQLLQELITYWRNRHVRVLLVTMPTSGIYERAVLARAELRAGVLKFDGILASLSGPDVEIERCFARPSLNLDDREDFLDYTHLTPGGAGRLTRLVIDTLKQRRWLPLDDLTTPAHESLVSRQ